MSDALSGPGLGFARFLRDVIDRAKKTGRGEQAWLVKLKVGNKSQIHEWLTGGEVPAEDAYEIAMDALRRAKLFDPVDEPEIDKAWRAARKVVVRTRRAKNKAITVAAPDGLSELQRDAWTRIGDVAERHPWIIERLLSLALKLVAVAEEAERPADAPGRAT